jgi:hypothetical protein
MSEDELVHTEFVLDPTNEHLIIHVPSGKKFSNFNEIVRFSGYNFDAKSKERILNELRKVKEEIWKSNIGDGAEKQYEYELQRLVILKQERDRVWTENLKAKGYKVFIKSQYSHFVSDDVIEVRLKDLSPDEVENLIKILPIRKKR